MKRHPVLVYWANSGETEYYETLKECAIALSTSTSHIKRLLKSGKLYPHKKDYCSIDDALRCK